MDTSHFKSLIHQRQSEISRIQESASQGAQAVELDQSKVGRLSRMDAIQVQQMSLESQRRMNRELFALKSALLRIDEGEFGVCVQCDDEINPKRLEIDLTATLCISCASSQENR